MRLALTLATLLLASAPALAQSAPSHPEGAQRFAQAQVPCFERGSNQRAGGPADCLNSPTGGLSVADPSVATQQGIPCYERGSNQRAGGPANCLNSPTGGIPVSDPGASVQQGIPCYDRGSNQRAGGPANCLNSPSGQ
ncbi:hypothetical protein [Salinarimonas soli]|uniref:Uncharacterized protein n=1 Tax=Salinarimonas soli TaxID=1638099 RepID=A0A5B2VCW1_9HYPH|nr:hypothetical protein [Salinarimonas soli]KAA2236598.1 hypothetical protein F0L46_14090 [Salinarimonas soli]